MQVVYSDIAVIPVYSVITRDTRYSKIIIFNKFIIIYKLRAKKCYNLTVFFPFVYDVIIYKVYISNFIYNGGRPCKLFWPMSYFNRPKFHTKCIRFPRTYSEGIIDYNSRGNGNSKKISRHF